MQWKMKRTEGWLSRSRAQSRERKRHKNDLGDAPYSKQARKVELLSFCGYLFEGA
jgi:hypothetical protein